MTQKRITTFELSKITATLYREHLQNAQNTVLQGVRDGLKDMGMDVKPEDIKESLDCAVQRGFLRRS